MNIFERNKPFALGKPSRRVLYIFLIGLALVAIRIGTEAAVFPFMPKIGLISNFFIELGAGVGEFLIIATTVAYVFSQIDQYEFMNKILDHRDLLVAVSSAGVDKIVANPTKSSYSDEIENHENFVVCLRGSKSFFTNRQSSILDRLDAGKSIHVFCNEKGMLEISSWKEEMSEKGWNMSNLYIARHDVTLMYNFLECDNGIWIKTYFSKFYNHKTAAPAFFIRKGSPLWKSYRQDIDLIMGIPNG